jgi:hypothetical protein
MAGRGSVHFWGGIHHGGKTDLVVLQNSVTKNEQTLYLP